MVWLTLPVVHCYKALFNTDILMYIIDRKFLSDTVWSVLADFFSLFGLINASNVGILLNTKDDDWRFCVVYTMLAILLLLLGIVQRKQWIKGPETESDDLSSVLNRLNGNESKH
ncbi:unnamed protein product [Rotaria magnacalcarata]